MSALMKLNSRDWVQGLVFAVLMGVLTYLQPVVTSADFSWSAFDWNNLINVAITSFIGYVTVSLSKDSEGKIGGVV